MTMKQCKKCLGHFEKINLVGDDYYPRLEYFLLCFECEKIFNVIRKKHIEEFYVKIDHFFQPERSKREDSHTSECIPVMVHDCWCSMKNGKKVCKKEQYEMRCSEHCSNAVRDK